MMYPDNDLLIHISPANGTLTVEEVVQGVTTCKEVSASVLLSCITESLRKAEQTYSTGLLPPGTLSVMQRTSKTGIIMEYPGRYADISYYETQYPHFPLPRMVVGFSVLENGKIENAGICVIEDETPALTTKLYRWPFSNVFGDHRICIGQNALPKYKLLSQTATLPAFLLSIPNNVHLFDRDHSRLDLEYRELLEHLKDKSPDYYYDEVLIQGTQTLADFIDTYRRSMDYE